MSPGGLTSTRVFFGESEHTNTEREKQENYSDNVHVFILKNKIDSGSTGAYQTCGYYTVETTCRSFRLGYEEKQTRVRKKSLLIMKIKMVADCLSVCNCLNDKSRCLRHS